MLIFQAYYEASEGFMTKLKPHTLHTERIKYWNADGSGNPPSLILALLNILLHKLATLGKHFEPEFKSLLKKWIYPIMAYVSNSNLQID